MAESNFREVIVFLDKIGIYDVVLPFLLVFTIVFAILEKTRILGTDEIQGKHYTKKNINSMVAFVMGFLVVASTKLVKIINETFANVVLLLALSVLFLMLIGSFYKQEEDVFLGGKWRIFFTFLMFIGIVLIFLNSLDWLSVIGDFFADNIGKSWFVSIIMVAALAGVIAFLTGEKKAPGAGKATGDSGGGSGQH